jgi:hypothetical protein
VDEQRSDYWRVENGRVRIESRKILVVWCEIRDVRGTVMKEGVRGLPVGQSTYPAQTYGCAENGSVMGLDG